MNQEKENILYVDDEEENLFTFDLVFGEHFNIITHVDPIKALAQVENDKGFRNSLKLVISDQRMPNLSGIEFLAQVKKILPEIPTIMLTGYSNQELLVDAINHVHIYSFADKPWRFEDLNKKIENAIHHYNLVLENRVLLNELTRQNEKLEMAINEIKKLKDQIEAENTYLREEINDSYQTTGIITQNKAFKKVLKSVENLAKSDSTILIFGETGTGKELIAKHFHTSGNRKDKPLIKINCAAIPANLIESELFGYEKGAFTGAVNRKIGRFELANEGTLFLDEIGEMPIDLQAKLLRVLQENEFERVGGVHTIKTNFRLIAATNRDLEKLIDEGKFRMDLFYRLNVIPITLPPLRDRKDDVPLLVDYFIKVYASKNSRIINKVTDEAIEKLKNYTWPGNIRELENIIERAVLTSSSNSLEINGAWFNNKSLPEGAEVLSLDENEKQLIIKVLKLTDGMINGKNGAAALLDINPSTLRSRIQKHGLNITKTIN